MSPDGVADADVGAGAGRGGAAPATDDAGALAGTGWRGLVLLRLQAESTGYGALETKRKVYFRVRRSYVCLNYG